MCHIQGMAGCITIYVYSVERECVYNVCVQCVCTMDVYSVESGVCTMYVYMCIV